MGITVCLSVCTGVFSLIAYAQVQVNQLNNEHAVAGKPLINDNRTEKSNPKYQKTAEHLADAIETSPLSFDTSAIPMVIDGKPLVAFRDFENMRTIVVVDGQVWSAKKDSFFLIIQREKAIEFAIPNEKPSKMSAKSAEDEPEEVEPMVIYAEREYVYIPEGSNGWGDPESSSAPQGPVPGETPQQACIRGCNNSYKALTNKCEKLRNLLARSVCFAAAAVGKAERTSNC